MLASCIPVSEFGEVPPPPGEAIPPAAAKYLVVVVLDACRADYLTYDHFPNIASLIQTGIHYPHAWCGQMEAITPASHASLGTGLFPKHDGGVIGFWWENPQTLSPYTCAPLTDSSDPNQPGGRYAVDPNIIESLIRGAKAPTMSRLLKDVDPSAKTYTASGNKYYAADAMGGPDADYITYFWNQGANEYRPVSMPGHELPAGILNDPSLRSYDYSTMILKNPGQQDSLVVDLATKVIERERPRIVMLNLPELDWPAAHVFGGPLDKPKVLHLMHNADRALGKLFDTYRKLGIFDETVFCIMGDHGVLPLQQQVDRIPAEQAVANAGTIIGDADFHTAGFLWMEDSSRAMKATTFVDDAQMQGVKGVYFLGQFAGRNQYLPSPATAARLAPDVDNAYRYMLETMNGPTAPHVALIYPERTGTIGAGGSVQWKGDHGGPSWASQNIALALSGPGIQKGQTSNFPARLVDLTPTFMRLLGVPYPALDGVALADGLQTPTSGEKAAQHRLARVISPVAATLRNQSTIDVRRLPGNLPTLAKTPKKPGNIGNQPNY